MSAPSIDAPRSFSGRSMNRRNSQRSNFELYSWLFMRISGIVLVFLVLGHLFIMNILDGGVQRINFAFVAGRWASPFWQVWDLTMLWLAMLHGTNGMRTIINDYAERDQTENLPGGTRVRCKRTPSTSSSWEPAVPVCALPSNPAVARVLRS
jgi:succinate dehydrogenase / fumarate reductase membrane anchor subunit